MSIQNTEDEQGILTAGRIVADVIRQVRRAVAPGRTTAELDQVAARAIQAHGAVEAPRMVYGFPGAVCLSINDEVVHGVPGARALRAGDILTIDVTVAKDGYFADAAVTVPVGAVSPRARRLIRCAQAAFHKSLAVVRPGQPVWKIGEAIDQEVRRWGYWIIPELYGHGVGRSIHEAPHVPNFADRSCTDRLEEGGPRPHYRAHGQRARLPRLPPPRPVDHRHRERRPFRPPRAHPHRDPRQPDSRHIIRSASPTLRSHRRGAEDAEESAAQSPPALLCALCASSKAGGASSLAPRATLRSLK